MHGLIVALVAASAAAQTCPASLISDKITTPLAGGTLYVSDGSEADFLNIVDLGDAAVRRPRVGIGKNSPAHCFIARSRSAARHVREVPVAGEEYWYGAPER
jgi:hypothetical protein